MVDSTRWDIMSCIKAHIKDFVEYLQIEKNASPYTVTYYHDDIMTFSTFLTGEGIEQLSDIDFQVVRLFLTRLYEQKLGRRSVSRKISSLRTYFKFMKREGFVSTN